MPEIDRCEFYSTKEKAIKGLQTIANSRRNNMAVTVTDDSPEKFSFILGWEERAVSWSIFELNIDKD